jgi:hypothetical protein
MNTRALHTRAGTSFGLGGVLLMAKPILRVGNRADRYACGGNGTEHQEQTEASPMGQGTQRPK